jgi:tryptophan-rich sensory protein
MSIEPTQEAPFPFFQKSPRGFGEQAAGLAIFVLAGLLVQAICNEFVQFSYLSDWFMGLAQAPWAMGKWAYGPLWIAYSLTLPVAAWLVWRTHPIRAVAMEIVCFSLLLFLQILWSFSFFFFRETLVGLSTLLVLWAFLIASLVLYWKRDKLAGQLLLLNFLWMSYLVSLNMVICVTNP